MSERGVFAVDRGIWDDPDFRAEPFTEREAFMWLVGAAAWCERVIRGSVGPISLDRGEFCFSVRFLAERFQWSSSRCGRFLDRLEKRDTLRDTSRDGAKVYLIKNYSRFQVVSLPSRDTKRDSKRNRSGTGAGQQRDKEENIKTIEDIEGKIERAKSLPPNWQPSSENQTKNLSQYPTPVLREELEKFRDHFTANGKRMKDWDAAFRNWMRRRGDFQRAPPRQTREERFRAVVAEHLEEIDSRANIVELRPGRRELCGPSSERSAGELHAAASGYENHAQAAYDPLHGKAEGDFDEDGPS